MAYSVFRLSLGVSVNGFCGACWHATSHQTDNMLTIVLVFTAFFFVKLINICFFASKMPMFCRKMLLLYFVTKDTRMLDSQIFSDLTTVKTLLEKGFLIGLFSSMPVGPIAIMCIQRTLSKGRWHGFFTGFGAAFSDLIYALIAGFGLAFVSDFINQNQMLIQIVGSVVILVFGYFIFKSNPVKQLTPAGNLSQSYWQDALTSFALTNTNPMMIFLFIGLYARFHFIISEHFVYNLFGIMAIFAGALS